MNTEIRINLGSFLKNSTQSCFGRDNREQYSCDLLFLRKLKKTKDKKKKDGCWCVTHSSSQPPLLPRLSESPHISWLGGNESITLMT